MLTARVVYGAGDDRAAAEASLDQAGVPLPLLTRTAWVRRTPRPDATALVVAGDGDTPVAACAVELLPSRALPGHRIWRVSKFGLGCTGESAAALAAALAGGARRDPRALRVDLASHHDDPARREEIARALAAARFARVPNERSYEHTVVLELDADDETLLARLPKQTRYDVRAPQRLPVAVRPIADAAYGPRMHALMTESLARTGAAYDPIDWAAVIALGAEQPARSRLVGLFRTDAEGPDALLALAWGHHHGPHAEYSAGASTRSTDLRANLACPLLWDLVTWARAGGAARFDFGGVTVAGAGDDALAGISDFKLKFSRTVLAVGSEWSYAAHPLRDRLARTAGALARRVRGGA